MVAVLASPSPESGAPPIQDLRRMLVCLDGTELGERGLPYARVLARAWNVQLTLLHVVEPPRRPGDPTPWDALDWEVARAEARSYLESVRARAAPWGMDLDVRLLQGYAPEQILNEARADGVDLTVLATRGDRDPSGWRLGITTTMVASRAQGSLLVVPTQSPPPGDGDEIRIRRVAVALDGSLRAEFVLPVAARIARDQGAELTLIHVVPRPEIPFPAYQTEDDRQVAERLERRNAQSAEHYLAQLRGRLQGEGVKVEVLLQREIHVQEGLAETAIRSSFDLLVLSAHGQTGSCRSPYGSTTQHLLCGGMVPLLILQDVPREEMEWHGCEDPQPAGPLPDREGVR